MPLFEYKCGRCGKEFEELVIKSDEKVKCPICETEEVNKLISAPTGVKTAGSADFSSYGSSCGPRGGFT